MNNVKPTFKEPQILVKLFKKSRQMGENLLKVSSKIKLVTREHSLDSFTEELYELKNPE